MSVLARSVVRMFECLSGAGVVAAGLIAPPSGELLVALLGVEAGRLNASAQVDLVVVWERMAAFVAGVAQPGLLAVAFTETHDGRDCPLEPEGSGRAEIGAALRLAPHVAGQRLLVAEQLCGRLACVQSGLLAGDFSYGHAAVIAMGTLELADELAVSVSVALRVLAKAAWQSIADVRRAVRAGWVLRRDARTAEATWTSPTGHVYRVEHEDHRSWADDVQEQNYRLGSARSDSTDRGDGDALVMADREPPVHEPTPEPQAA